MRDEFTTRRQIGPAPGSKPGNLQQVARSLSPFRDLLLCGQGMDLVVWLTTEFSGCPACLVLSETNKSLDSMHKKSISPD